MRHLTWQKQIIRAAEKLTEILPLSPQPTRIKAKAGGKMAAGAKTAPAEKKAKIAGPRRPQTSLKLL